MINNTKSDVLQYVLFFVYTTNDNVDVFQSVTF